MLIDRTIDTSKNVEKLLQEISIDPGVTLALKYSVKNTFPEHKKLLEQILGTVEYTKEDFINAGEIDYANNRFGKRCYML